MSQRYLSLCCFSGSKNSKHYYTVNIYSRNSVAQTLMACISWLFRVRSCVPNKNSIAADIIVFGIILGDFLFYIDNCMLCTH